MTRILTKIWPSAWLVYGLLTIFAGGVFLGHYFISGQAVYGDGIGYFAHLHTWVVDGDFDHTNEYRHIYNHTNNNAVVPLVAPVVQIVATTSAGKAENHYSPGVAILLLPAYGLAHGLSLFLSGLGWSVSTTGYGDMYQILSGLMAVGYVVIGLWFAEEIAFKFTGDRVMSRLSSLGIFLATNLLYYGSFDVLNSHFASFFLASYFFYLLLTKERSFFRELVLGIVVGLLLTNRLQDGAVVIIWLVDVIRSMVMSKKVEWQRYGGYVGCFGIGAMIMVIPLLLHWYVTFPALTQHTYIRGLWLTYSDHHVPDLFGSLFHLQTGLFSRTPLLLLAFLGWVYFGKKWSTWQLQLLQLFFGMQFVVISVQGGWHAAAYGGRMYISSLIFFVVLIAKLLVILKQKDIKYPFLLIGIVITLNVVSMLHFIGWEKGAESGRKGIEVRTLERIKSWQLRI